MTARAAACKVRLDPWIVTCSPFLFPVMLQDLYGLSVFFFSVV